MATSTEKYQSSITEELCCPLFEIEKWDNVHHEWKDKLFLKDTVPEIFHIPLPGTYNKVILNMWEKAFNAGAAPANNDFLLLAHDPSAFKAELFMSITKEIPGEECVQISGTFFSKVFEGLYNKVPRFIKEMAQYLASNHLVSVKDYIYFPYCPKCARKFGHNYIVVVSEIAPM